MPQDMFEIAQAEAAAIRAKSLGINKAQRDAEIKAYYDNKVAGARNPALGSEGAAATADDNATKEYYDSTVPAMRKKEQGG